MMKKTLLILLSSFALTNATFAVSRDDMDLELQSLNECTDFDDPYESVNRKIFAFNSVLDQLILRPIAKTYIFWLGDSSRAKVSNIMTNLYTPVSMVNNLFQGNVKGVNHDFWRFIINSSFGILGAYDVAAQSGLAEDNQSFGSTLARYGVAPGPYLVLPIVGSSSARDVTDYIVDPVFDPYNWFLNKNVIEARFVVNGLNRRAEVMPATDQIQKTSLDPYVSIRTMFFQNREKKVKYPKSVKKTCNPEFYTKN